MTLALDTFQLYPTTILKETGLHMRLWYSTTFLDVDGVQVQFGTGTSPFYIRFECSITSGIVTVETENIFTTIDAQISTPQSIQVFARLFNNNTPRDWVFSGWVIPSEAQYPGGAITLEQLTIYNEETVIANPPANFWTQQQTINYFNTLSPAPHASALVEGITFLDVAPLVAIHPEAVGSNSPLLSGLQFNIVAYGASTGGTAAANATAITAAVTAANLAGGAIGVPIGTFTTNSVTISVPVTFVGAGSILSPATGQTITITKAVDANVSKHFNNALSGQGTVSFLGNYALQIVYPEWWGAGPALSAAVNTPALQAAIIGAYGTLRTNPSGLWVYNRILHFSGRYQIDNELACHNVTGFRWTGENKFNSGIIQTAVNKRIIDGDGISYGVFEGLNFATTASQNLPLVDLDWTGLQTADLRPQNITFQDCTFGGNGVGFIGVQVAKSGGGSQGDNIRFYNCYGSGFLEAAVQLGGGPSFNYAYNAIHVEWIGGDIQSCPKYGLAAYGGSFIVKHATFENGNFVYPTGAAQTGYDLFSEGSQNVNVVEDVRSESLRFAFGAWDVKNCTVLGPATTFVAQWPALPGTQSFIQQLVTGTPYGGDGKMYVVTSGTVFDTFRDIIAPFNAPSFSTPNWTLVFNVVGPLVPGALVGDTVVIQYPNCFQVYTTVTANGATSITVTSLSQIFQPGNVSPAQTCGSTTQYARVISLPTFGGLGNTAATGGSLTTIISAGAGWGVNAYVGDKVTIMSGVGKYQYGIITGNTADTITVAAGWVTDYPEVGGVNVGGVTTGKVTIVAPDATSHFVVEPNWNGGTITSGSVSMDFFALTSLSTSGDINQFNAGLGARIACGSANGFLSSVKNIIVTRQDWCVNSPEDTYPRLYVERVQVVRPGATDGEYLPWAFPRNAYAATFKDVSQHQQCREAIVWSEGQPGGGPGFIDVWVNRGDGIINNDVNAISRNVLAYQGMLGRKTPLPTLNGVAAPDQAGLATQIQGGLSTGSGAPGPIEFWLGATGSTGTAVNAGSKKVYLDINGLHVPVALCYPPLAPAQITSNQNDYNPGAPTPYLRLITDASRNVTGLTFTPTQADGQMHVVVNIGLADLVLKHQDVGSAAANRFYCSTALDITLTPKQSALALYDTTNLYWLVYPLNVGTGTTGTGLTVLQTTPTLVTPVLGTATAASVAASSFLKVDATGKLTTAPKTNDVWGAAISLDVTISSHDITGIFGTSATSTITPTAAGSAGDWVFINTINGAGGSVVVTFAATFHSSGTQTTQASRFSSIAFRSDGVRWVEQYRTTDLT